MTTTVYNAQFLTLDFRLLDHPGFNTFMRTAAFGVYLQLRRYVWRGRDKRHPLARVNELYREGKLVAAVSRELLARKVGIAELSHVSRHLTDLVERGVVRRERTGRQNAYVLGTWEDRSLARDGSYKVELFYLERAFGADDYGQVRIGEVPPDMPGADVSVSDTSDVSVSDTSDVSFATPINKEINKKKKEPRRARVREAPDCGGARIRFRSPFEPIDDKERPDDVLVVED